ncbi:hypothetical protein DIPPA_32006 [Diplonema papillatum]|nr:hypothetical protein DIPPA_32006 [Diplonema papillatum]
MSVASRASLFGQGSPDSSPAPSKISSKRPAPLQSTDGKKPPKEAPTSPFALTVPQKNRGRSASKFQAPVPKSPLMPPPPKSPMASATKSPRANPAKSPAANPVEPAPASHASQPTPMSQPASVPSGLSRQGVVPQLKSTRVESMVLSPEERRKLHHQMADQIQTRGVIPEIQKSREEIEVLSPEERRRLKMEELAAQQGKRITSVKLGPDDGVLPPEERLRLARESNEVRMMALETQGALEAEQDALRAAAEAAAQGDMSRKAKEEAKAENARRRAAEAAKLAELTEKRQRDNNSRKNSIVSNPDSAAPEPAGGQTPQRLPSAQTLAASPSVHSTPQTSALPVTKQLSMLSRNSKTSVPQSPLSPSHRCPNCAQAQLRIDELLDERATLQSDLYNARQKITELEHAKPGSDSGHPSKRKHHKAAAGDDGARKDRRIKELEAELRQERAAGGGGGGEAAAHHKDAEIAELHAQIDEYQRQLAAAHAGEDGGDGVSESGTSAVDGEMQLLNTQIWALETAVELRTKEIYRKEALLQQFIQKVDTLDHELADAMRQLVDKGTAESAELEMAAMGGATVDQAVAEMQESRAETKKKRRRSSRGKRGGKLSKENAELRDELADAREDAHRLRKALSEKDPAAYLAACQRGLIAPGQGRGTGSGSQKPCCFQAAFAAAAQAEAQLEPLRAEIREKTKRLDAAHKAIAHSAGSGYENEVKLQQARKALTLCAGPASPDGYKSSRGPMVSSVVPAAALAYPPPGAQKRTVSPTRTAKAWMNLNPHHYPIDLRAGAPTLIWESPMHG